MIEKVKDTIKKYNLIENGDKVIAAVPGGPDSIAMLDILIKLKNSKDFDFEVVVAHVNHMIRDDATADEQYVENYCKKNQVKFYVQRIDVNKYANNNKMGIEEAGRKIRYNFFDEVMKITKSNKIAIAHNKNDKVETIMMNIIRGAGLAGLKGIESKRNNKYIRPLIECERNEIENYCNENKLEPRIDKTNFENDYTRNKIRNVVLPYIKEEFNPNFIETINRLSKVAAETEEFLEVETIKIYKDIVLEEEKETIVLDLKRFNSQELLLRKRVLIYTIAKVLGNVQNIEKVNIDDLIKLCENNIGNKYLKPRKEIKIKVNKGKIFFERLN